MNSWQEERKNSALEVKSLSFALEVMSRAKGIRLVDGVITAWDLLVAQDIAAGNFEFIDVLEAMKQAVRAPMYNRIDYSDIYEIAVEIYKKRRQEEEWVNIFANFNNEFKIAEDNL